MTLVGVIHPGAAKDERVAGLTVAGRAERLLRRAGCARVIAASSPEEVLALAPARVVAVLGDVVFDAGLLERLLAHGSAVARAGRGAVLAGDAAAVLRHEGRLVEGGIYPAADHRERLLAERALLRATAKPTDGLLRRRIDRPLAALLARGLARAGVSPSAVTLASLGVGLAGAVALAAGAPLVGAGLLLLAKIGDTCDGTLARGTLAESDSGDRLDTIADVVLTAAVFIAIGGSFLRDGGSPAIAAALVLGAVASCAAHEVFRRRPGAGALHGVMGRAALVDWHYAVLALAALGRLDVLVIGGAVASVAFAATYVAVGLASTRPAPA